MIRRYDYMDTPRVLFCEYEVRKECVELVRGDSFKLVVAELPKNVGSFVDVELGWIDSYQDIEYVACNDVDSHGDA